MKLRSAIEACVVAALATGSAVPISAQEAKACGDTPGFSKLDFWLGEWEVFVGDSKVGDNRIEKILDGCAVMEHWVDASGSEGKSLFFYTPATDAWKQVWVTESATRAGGVKEKTLVLELDDGGVRFRGEIALSDGRTYHDRTTLTPLGNGAVRQLIEVSRDGATWQPSFDAIYRPAG